MYDDGRNGARARSARSRSAHEYEATTLDAMRRRARAREERRPGRAWRRVVLLATLGRARARRSGLEALAPVEPERDVLVLPE